MDKITIAKIFVIICIFILFLSIGAFSLIRDEERLSGCKDLCEYKKMEYYRYKVVVGETFCTCLNNGVENKFVLVATGEGDENGS